MKRIVSAILGLLALAVGATTLTTNAAYPNGNLSPVSQAQGNAAAQQTQQITLRSPVVVQAAYFDVSPPLRSIPPAPPSSGRSESGERENYLLPRSRVPEYAGVDPVVQTFFGALAMPTPELTFEGYSQADNYSLYPYGVLPPDTEGAVGPDHYFQWNNIGFRIFDKAGNTVYGPAKGSSLFTGSPGPCAAQDWGDPIVLYDTMADRWLATQFMTNGAPSGPTYECIAVSTTSDPTGSYNRYQFLVSPVMTPTLFEDYPHFGVWPDAYYMTTNEFQALTFAGAGNFAFDRAKMLAGDPTATFQYFHLDPPHGGFLPSDMDGPTPPPAGSPNYFVELGPSRLDVFEFHVDFANPANSTFTGPVAVQVAPYDDLLCGASRGACIPQPGTTQALEVISDRLMYRLAYRNFGTHESVVVNHTVDADGNGKAGVRWYELRGLSGTPNLHQQGTYSPDADHRWMGSIAMDRQGNMALGYSVSNGTNLFPTIRYAGRLAGDPLGQMAQGETTMYPGGGSQTGYARWGDYSMMDIDPVDDCTFWYTQEYYATTNEGDWTTRIGKFKYPSCGGGTPVPTATGTPPTATATRTTVPATATRTAAATSTPGGATATLAPKVILYDQFNQQGVLGSPSFQSGATFIQIADDFVVPEGERWEINEVDVDGFYSPETARATSVNVYFYSDVISGGIHLPGTAVLTRTNVIPLAGLDTGQFAVPVAPSLSLLPGAYWVSVQANTPAANQRWLWLGRVPPPAFNPAVSRNPNGLTCQDWTPRTLCSGDPSPDEVYRLHGRRYFTGGGGTATVTATAATPVATSTSTATALTTAVATSTATIAATATASCTPTSDYTFTSSLGNPIVPGTSQVPGSVCDDCIVPITLPFPYTFYGTNYTTVNASNKGNLQFASNNPTGANTCLPTPALNYAILPFWDNLNTNINDVMGIYTRVMGTAPNRTFVIEWRAGQVANDVRFNFEVLLYEGQCRFDFIYGQVVGAGNGISATIGVQEGTGSRFTQYSCNTASVQTGQRITFQCQTCPGGPFKPNSP